MSKYEQGKDAPNSTRLIQLADALGVNPEYFFRPDTVELGEVNFRKHLAFGIWQQEAVKEQVREHLERYLAAERLFDSEDHSHGFAQWRAFFKVANTDDIEKAAEGLRDVAPWHQSEPWPKGLLPRPERRNYWGSVLERSRM